MPYRYTNTDKWKDAWFSKLKPMEKLLFNYLCDNCDCAGFIEIIEKNWASDIGCNLNIIEGARKGLERGLIYSITNDCIYLRTFLRHQKNLPLNENNQCHKGIFKRFELYKHKFNIVDINQFIEGAWKGLERGYGNGNGIGNLKDKEDSKDIITKTWRNDFETYKNELREAYNKAISDNSYIEERQKFHPGLNIIRSLNKSCHDYWVTEVGWKKKKSSKIEFIDWIATFNNALSIKSNQVWGDKQEKSNNGLSEESKKHLLNLMETKQI
jgi:hypothetical protein